MTYIVREYRAWKNNLAIFTIIEETHKPNEVVLYHRGRKRLTTRMCREIISLLKKRDLIPSLGCYIHGFDNYPPIQSKAFRRYEAK